MNRDDTNFYLWITFVSNHDDFTQRTVIFADRFWSAKSICSLRASHNSYILYQRYRVNITTLKSRGRVSILLFNTLTATRVFKEISARPRVFSKKSSSGHACSSTKCSLLGAPIDILVMRVVHVLVSRMIFRFVCSQH